MRVVEIFRSIQGEGIHMGRPCTFVRFAGCNLSCEFCDTKHDTFTEMSVAEIMGEVTRHRGRFTVLTGGEPFLQEELEELAAALEDGGYEVAAETNGTINAPWLAHRQIHVACSPKGVLNLDTKFIDELKYVVTNQAGFSDSICEKFAGRIWLQPCSNEPQYMRRCYELAVQDPRLRVGIQLHKIYGVE
jgi:organic radical activating enzyme